MFHASAQATGESLGEAVHVEHAQVAASALANVVAGDAAEGADVVQRVMRAETPAELLLFDMAA